MERISNSHLHKFNQTLTLNLVSGELSGVELASDRDCDTRGWGEDTAGGEQTPDCLRGLWVTGFILRSSSPL